MQERLDSGRDQAPSAEIGPEQSMTARADWRRLVPVAAPLIVFAALASLFLLALQKGDPSRIPSALIGRAAPSLILPPVDGLVRDGAAIPGLLPADLVRGRPVVVNFWASWCQPCVDEHPQLVALASATGVPILGINHRDQPANATRFIARYGNPYALVGADANGRAAIEWGVYGMPETFVLDGTGKVVYKHVGPITRESLQQQVLPALEKAAASR